MISPSLLAACYASRVSHDVVSPLISITHGLDMMEDPAFADMQEEAVDSIKAGAKRISAIVQFMRFALGTQGLSPSQADIHAVRTLIEDFVAVSKPTLELEIAIDAVSCRHLRLMMQMILMSMESLARGGVIRAAIRPSGETIDIEIIGEGPRTQMRKGDADALAGVMPEDGWAAQNVVPIAARELATEMGATIVVETGDGTIRFLAAGLPPME